MKKAFPSHPTPTEYDSGMNLRDWFAGCVLVGINAGPENRSINPYSDLTVGQQIAEFRKLDAEYCYAMADAMMAARDEKITE